MKIHNFNKRQDLGLSATDNALTLQDGAYPVIKIAVRFSLFAMATLIVFFAWRLFSPDGLMAGLQAVHDVMVTDIFWIAVAVGFFAQAVDGALGMAGGVTATSFLLSMGAGPAAASASVHIAKIFTAGFSGVAHAKFGNVDRQLFLCLLLPGIVGGIVGAFAVTQIDGATIKPYVSAYLLLMGIYILAKAFRYIRLQHGKPKHVGKLALLGGFVDTAGGGGWGPVVTTTLLGTGHDPRTTIGSVNFAEFFVALTSAATFTVLLGMGTWPLVAGLILGGLFAAPFAAFLCGRVPARVLIAVVGVLISALSTYNLCQALG